MKLPPNVVPLPSESRPHSEPSWVARVVARLLDGRQAGDGHDPTFLDHFAQPANGDPDITVVVCTYNRASLLRRALDSLRWQRCDGRFTYEVVVVDRASTDKTPLEIAAAAHDFPIPLRRVFERRSGLAQAINHGIEQARGRWIALLADDQIADRHWLATLVETARIKRCRCVGGAARLILPAATAPPPPMCRALLGETRTGRTPRRMTRNHAESVGNLLFDRCLVDDVGQFEERPDAITAHASFLRRASRAGIDCWYAPDAIAGRVVAPQQLTDEYLLEAARRSASLASAATGSDATQPRSLLSLAAELIETIVWEARWLLAWALRDEPYTLDALCRLHVSRPIFLMRRTSRATQPLAASIDAPNSALSPMASDDVLPIATQLGDSAT
jgi:hypothetical protein